MSRQTIDLTGRRFGMLTVLELLPERKNGHLVWRCRCDCGETVDVARPNLTSEKPRSCGCSRGGVMKRPLVRQKVERKIGPTRRTPYPPNEKCRNYGPELGKCIVLKETLCATRGKCSFFCGDVP